MLCGRGAGRERRRRCRAGQGARLHLPWLPRRAGLQERLPELQRAEARRPERAVPDQRPERLRQRRPRRTRRCTRRPPRSPTRIAPTSPPILQSEVVQPGKQVVGTPPPATQTCVSCHGTDGAKTIGPEYPILAGAVPRLHRAGAAATTRAASARTRSWPASSPASTRRTSRRSPSSSASSTGCAAPIELRKHGKCDKEGGSGQSDAELSRIPHSPGGRQDRRRAWRRSAWTISAPATSSSRSATRRSTTRTRSRRPAPARSCASTRWSAASISPAKSCPRSTPTFKPGQKVLVNGCGLSETHDGGYAEYARVQGDWVVPIPAGPRRVPVHGDRHRRLHRRARDPSHGAERPDAGRGQRRDRRDRRDRRRRQPRHRHARGPRLPGRGGDRQEILDGVSRTARRRPRAVARRRSISARARSKKRSGPARSTISAATCSRG